MKGTNATKSCIACKCLKSKCDFQVPCSKCQVAGIQCEYADPKAAKQSGERLRERVAKLEGLLKVIVDKISDGQPAQLANSALKSDTSTTKDGGKAITQGGRTIYIANSVWSNICHEIDMLNDTPSPSNDIVFGFADYTPLDHKLEAQSLWTTYLQSIDPLTKIIDRSATEALLNKEYPAKAEDALLSSCWFAAVNSLDESTCVSLVGCTKTQALSLYKRRAERALLNANYLHTSSLICLQAFVIYLLVDHTSALLAVAVHLAQKLGLDKSSSLFTLTPRETKLRRRLWLQIIHMDARACELSGSLSKIMPNDDVDSISKTPSDLLLDDEIAQDLCFVRFRACIGTYYRHLYNGSPQTDSLLEELECHFEKEFIAPADPLDNLQFFTSLTARHVISSLKVSRLLQRTEGSAMLEEAIKYLEYENLTMTLAELECFRWHIKSYFQYHIFISILKELKLREKSPLVDKAWIQVQQVYHNRPEMFKNDSLHSSVRRLTLEASDKQHASSRIFGGGSPTSSSGPSDYSNHSYYAIPGNAYTFQ